MIRPLFFGMLLCILFSACEKANIAATPPNIIILFTDDQRFNTIRALGNAAVYTPNLDRLAAMGVSYTRAHIPGGNSGAVCAPSRAMLLSGRSFYQLPKSFTTPWSVAEDRGHSDFITFPELFRDAGYETFFTGKWHNAPPKLAAGFSTGEHIYMGGMHFLKDGGHERPWVQKYDSTGFFPAKDKVQMDTFSSELYTNAALRFLQKSHEQPFLMMVSYTSPHDPRQAPSNFQALYPTDSIQLPPNFMREHPFDIGSTHERDENLLPQPREPEAVKGEIAGYYAMISEVDAQIGRILDELESSGKLENSILVFAGDNGLGVGQHSLLGKQNLYEHSVRVPLIIAGPKIPKGKRSNALAMLLDLFPTLCDLSGQPTPQSILGKSLVPSFSALDQNLREHIFLSFTHKYRGIRTADNWKYIHYFVNGAIHEQLFNLNDDPWEINNLIELEQHQFQKEKLKHLLLEELVANKDDYLSPKFEVEYTSLQEAAKINILNAFPDLPIHYTTNGSEPTLQSKAFEGILRFDSSVQIKAQGFWQGQAIGQAIATEVPKINDLAGITWNTEPAERYAARGKYSLVDGLKGSNQFRDGRWLGFQEEDLEVTLELSHLKTLKAVNVSLLQHVDDWIFYPKKVSILASNDGKSYRKLINHQYDIKPDSKGIDQSSLIWNSKEGVKAKFIKIQFENQGTCPDWHKGAGGKAWLFLDEIGFQTQ